MLTGFAPWDVGRDDAEVVCGSRRQAGEPLFDLYRFCPRPDVFVRNRNGAPVFDSWRPYSKR